MLKNSHFFESDWSELGHDDELGSVIQPRTLVSIKSKDGRWEDFDTKIDTGAVITFFNYSDCGRLGLNLYAGKRKVLGGVNSRVVTYIHQVELKIGDEIFHDVKIAFWNKRKVETERLLGISSLFTYFQLSMRAKILKSYFTREWGT